MFDETLPEYEITPNKVSRFHPHADSIRGYHCANWECSRIIMLVEPPTENVYCPQCSILSRALEGIDLSDL